MVKTIQFSLIFRRLCLAGLCFPICFAVASESYKPKRVDPLSEAWRWRHITPLDDAGFRCMEEGADGAMWFGVNQGVLRYDGLRFRAFAENDGFTDNAILWICRATDGSIYAASVYALWRFNDDVWTKIPISMRIRCLERSSSGVWVGTNDGALHIALNGEMTFYSTKAGMVAAKKTINTAFTKYLIPENIIQSKKFSVTSVCEDNKGRVWLAVNTRQLVRLNPKTKSADESSYLVHSQRENRLLLRWPIQIDKSDKGQIWTTSAAGMYRFFESSNKWIRQSQPDKEGNIGQTFATALCKDNTLLLAILNKLYVWQNEAWTSYPIPSLEQSSPHLLETSDGNLWLGKEQGKVFRINRTHEQWSTFNDLHFQCDDAEDRSWFMTSNNRAVVWDKGTWTSYSAEDGLMDTLLALYCSQAGQVWAIGSHRHTAATAYLKEGRWVRDVHKKLGECFDARIGAELSDGRMVFAPRRPRKDANIGGLLYAVPEDGGGYSFKKEILPGQYTGLTGLVEVGSGELYYSLFRLYHKKGDAFKEVPTPFRFKSRVVDCMTTDPSQTLWLAFRDYGVCHLNGTNWVGYTSKEGLGTSRASALACAKDGTVWASMAHGFSRFDGQQWQSNILDAALPGIPVESGSLRLDRHDFLRINYCSSTWYIRESIIVPYIKDADFSFKTIRYRPLRDKPETDLISYSKEVSSEGNVFFEWSGVSRWESTPRKELTYSWHLGDGEWSPYAKKTNQFFLNLAPGDYRFEVRARDRDFNVDPTPASCSFTVLVPVWQQAWFVVLVSSFVLGLILLTYFLVRAKGDVQRNQIEVEQVKLRFFTGISHELRTPLTVLLGPLESIFQNSPEGKTKELLRMMLRNGKKLQELVDQILDIRKLEAGKMPIEWTQVDIVQFVRALVETLKPLADQKQIQCDMRLPQATCSVLCDPDKFQKIIGNLVSNAIKYTSSGGTVRVTAQIIYAGDYTPESIQVVVEDSGVGISKEQQQRIFEPYYRSDEKTKGTGLGLALVKELVDLLDGTISVTSPLSDAGGTRFTVGLPLQIPPVSEMDLVGEKSVKERMNLNERTSAQESGSLLIVDDNEDIRAFIDSELGTIYQLHQAENGLTGLALAKEIMPDLVITDVMMPVMDGSEFCQQLKTDPLTCHIPVIMLTARSSHQHEMDGRTHGADDYVSKPFSMPLLQLRIANLLESRRKLRERYSQQIEIGMLDMTVESADQEFMERAIRTVEENMADWNFGVDQFAEAMHLTVRSLRYKLKAVADQTPSSLIRTVRLKHAKCLLEQSGNDLTVSEIASSLGFTDMSYFGKAFKKQFGKPPSAFSSKG